MPSMTTKYEEGSEGATSPRIIEKLRRAKEFYGDVLAEFCLSACLYRVPVLTIEFHNEAMTLPSADLWRQAEEAEIKSLNGNNVLLPTRLSAGQKLMHTKWIYSMKYDTEGNIIKRKARLVAQGFRQVFGVNFDET